MESNKQEKSNLLNDNPIARRAGGSWMSKHSVAGSSPLHKGGSALYQVKPTRPGSNAKGQSQDDVMKSREAGYNAANKSLTDFQNTFKDATFGSQGEADTYNNEQSRLLNATNERADAYTTSNDSISNVNKAYNKKVTAYNSAINSPAQQKQKQPRGLEKADIAMRKLAELGREIANNSPDYGTNDAQKARDKKNKVKCAPGQVKILGKCVTGANPKPRGGVTKNTSIKGTRANTEKAAAKAKKDAKNSPIKNKSTGKNGKTHGEMTSKERHNHSMVHHLAKNPTSGKDKTQTIIDKARDNKKKIEAKKSPIKNNEDGQAHSQLGKKELRTHMKVKHGKKSPKVQLAKQPKVKVYKNTTFTDYKEVPAKAEAVYKVKVKK